MALKFRLKGLAETFIDEIACPGCGFRANDDEHFSTEMTKVTYEGIVVVVQCRSCAEIFVPASQRFGVLNPNELRVAVENDSQDTGEPIHVDLKAVILTAERLNAQRRGGVH